MQEKKNILLTGATGTMGFEGLKQLIENESFYLTLLVKPGSKNRKKLKKYTNHERVRIVWGDLRCYEDVLKSVNGIDIVLHVGGMVSPKADKYPELTMEVNVLAAKNIIKAVKIQPDADRIKVVYIGSVAQMGHKDAPNHFSCAGDRMNPALFDHYAVSKIMAEQIIAESGLKYWVSLRQTGILYPELVKNGLNPITFHVPLKGVLEWATVEDSGRLLKKLCENNLPEDFWRKFYNISSGKSFRLTNYEFESKMLKALYCPPMEKIFGANWFATKNFHGCWYSDADVLQDYLQFRNPISSDDYFQQVLRKSVPWYFRLVKIVPSGLIKLIMRQIAHSSNTGTMHWIKSNNQEKIKTYFGSFEAWKQLPSWEQLDKERPSENCPLDNKNYLAAKSIHEWNLDDMHQLANVHSGKCLSHMMIKGDIDTLLFWENSNGNQFHASPRYVAFGGFFPDGRLHSEIAKGYQGIFGHSPLQIQ
jgi:nucleoside-diphosphate-sugar epimerase